MEMGGVNKVLSSSCNYDLCSGITEGSIMDEKVAESSGALEALVDNVFKKITANYRQF